MIKTTLIVCTKTGKAPYIKECLGSILIQKKLPDEVIIVDDASDDGCEEIIKDFIQKNSDKFEKLAHYKHTRFLGKGATINTGIENSTGDIIIWISADDFMKPEYIETHYEMHKESNLDFCTYGGYDLYNESSNMIAYADVPDFSDPELVEEFGFFVYLRPMNCPINFGTLCVPRKIYYKVGAYDPECWVAEDYDWLLRASLIHKVIFKRYSGRPYVYRAGTNNTTGNAVPEIQRLTERSRQKVLNFAKNNKL